jgi:hypothetical protein
MQLTLSCPSTPLCKTLIRSTRSTESVLITIHYNTHIFISKQKKVFQQAWPWYHSCPGQPSNNQTGTPTLNPWLCITTKSQCFQNGHLSIRERSMHLHASSATSSSGALGNTCHASHTNQQIVRSMKTFFSPGKLGAGWSIMQPCHGRGHNCFWTKVAEIPAIKKSQPFILDSWKMMGMESTEIQKTASSNT